MRARATRPRGVNYWSVIGMISNAWLPSVSIVALQRIDASDIVQEALTDAAQRIDEYLRERPLPLLGWLRGSRASVLFKHTDFTCLPGVAACLAKAWRSNCPMHRRSSWCAGSLPAIPARATK